MVPIRVQRDVFLTEPHAPVYPVTVHVSRNVVDHSGFVSRPIATPGNDNVWDVRYARDVCGQYDLHGIRLSPGANVGLYPIDPPEGLHLVSLSYDLHQTGLLFSPCVVEFAPGTMRALFIHNPQKHYVDIDLTQPIFVAIPVNLNS